MDIVKIHRTSPGSFFFSGKQGSGDFLLPFVHSYPVADFYLSVKKGILLFVFNLPF